MPAVAWLVATVLLGAAEGMTGDFFLLMLAGGALATAGFTALTDFPVWVDGLFFAVASVALLLGVRPVLLRRLRRPPALTTGADALAGRHALVLEEVNANAGLVKLDGEVWTARPLDETENYPPGATVTVLKVDGATALVWRGP